MNKSMPSVYVKTLGCKVNTFDGHALENQFKTQGYHLTEEAEAADITIVNTCSVTANADREARYLARRLRRDNPKTVLVFTGCYAQTDSAELTAMDEIDLVIPNEIKDRLVNIVHENLNLRQAGATAEELRSLKLPASVNPVKHNRQEHFKSSVTLFDQAHSSQTRAFVKIQDGCNGFCTYCLIPYARGQSRSVAPELIIAEVARLIATGCPEIVLTGIHLGDYGRDLAVYANHFHPLVDLMRSLFALPGLGRLRLSSLEPGELSLELIQLLAEHRELFCDHLHLPLQSGSDPILKKMRRSYNKSEYAGALELIRRYFPDANCGADVIPGFPGESEEDFEETYKFIEEQQLSYLHVFPYSKRPNTAAARMPGHLEGPVVKERAARLRQLSEQQAGRYARQFIGRRLAALWENDLDSAGRRLGHTANYLSVVAAGSTPEVGAISEVLIKGFVEQGKLLARPLS